MTPTVRAMTINYELDGPVAIVTIERPAVKNCVDRPTAKELAQAFRHFDGDDALAVAVLTGSDRAFCAGADLKATAAGRGNRVATDGDGPMGPTRMLLSKPVIAAVEGHAVAGGWSWPCGVISGWCRKMRCSESIAGDGGFRSSMAGRSGYLG